MQLSFKARTYLTLIGGVSQTPACLSIYNCHYYQWIWWLCPLWPLFDRTDCCVTSEDTSGLISWYLCRSLWHNPGLSLHCLWWNANPSRGYSLPVGMMQCTVYSWGEGIRSKYRNWLDKRFIAWRCFGRALSATDWCPISAGLNGAVHHNYCHILLFWINSILFLISPSYYYYNILIIIVVVIVIIIAYCLSSVLFYFIY